MKHFLSAPDRDILNRRISEAEEHTGAQIVLAAINRCDNYNDIPWKAFALGVSVAAITVFFMGLFIPAWMTYSVIILSVALILGTGAVFSLISIFIPRIARLLISGDRKENETFQYAESLFLNRELFATEGRRGVLLLISLFEKQVIILADTGVRNRLNNERIKAIIAGMVPYLRKNEIKNAFGSGLTEIIETLSPPLSGENGRNELSNEIIEEEGA